MPAQPARGNDSIRPNTRARFGAAHLAPASPSTVAARALVPERAAEAQGAHTARCSPNKRASAAVSR